MHGNRPTVAVILAGGIGERVGLPMPKQLAKIAGKPIIEHTLAVFDTCPDVDEVVVMMTPGHVPAVQDIVRRAGFGKVSCVVEGGRTRNETTERALDVIGDRDCDVLFHDAVRPFVTHRIIAECVQQLRHYEAVDVVIPSADTIVVADGPVLAEIPARATLRRGQTPQGFRISTIRRAYKIAAEDPGFAATDDCGVVLRYLPDVPIGLVAGSAENMKVTEPVDLFIADKLFQMAAHTPHPGHSPAAYTDGLRDKTLVVFGGSYGIGADVAELAARHGARVFTFSRSDNGTHVENPEHVEEALARVHAETGRIDYVVNTAGVLRTGELADTDHATIEEALRVNYLAPVHIARSAFPYLARTQGQLLLYTSSSYTRGRADYSLYSSAKAAVVNLTQALAEEWAPHRVRINCVNPERTRTPMRTRAFGDEPADTLLTSAEVAQISVDTLISGMTGHVIDVRRDDPLRAPGRAAPPGPRAGSVPTLTR
ncbi:bifunctional cytidylyltransferase/SDR family oxidoreductase [Yinghuangia seranimata]|uniref:bifunctional cytidylyltransferase/SDR family oxidoreductase n=1 Tax=Yinghuangia seranimata TaxID=408067 RepID=UPI00248C70DD|nr:bifunctional cytidylyltransferase/SDR family oxidoreductase [Yinghuangia seranimata]MDI2125110.1 bifunctional cytidylyltransferase/SDR family oxidoreductase [Yinghuangia seranimata]